MKILRYAVHKVYHDVLKRNRIYKNWRQLNQTQWWEQDKIKSHQTSKLLKLLRHASDNVRYYQPLIDQSALNIDNAIDVLQDLPLIDKPIIRREFNNLCVSDRERYGYSEGSTSGSTGENLFFLLDNACLSATTAAVLRSYSWCGVSPFDRQASLWGATFDKVTTSSIVDRFRQFSMPMLFLSSFDMSKSNMGQYAEQLIRHRPKLLTSYPSPLEHFAQYCRLNNISLPSLKAIICSAEQLFDHQRKLFEAVFGVPVFNRYGCREFGNVAHECEVHHGLHVVVDRLYVEILDELGNPCPPGKIGELVITDLDNYVMPFIRYRVGDMAAWAPENLCPCGRGLPLFETIEGRAFDLVKSKSGTIISGTFWTLLLRHVSKNIKAFQIRQDNLESINILIDMMDDRTLSPEETQNLLGEISDKAPDLAVEIRYVDSIPLTRSGKRRFVISNLSP